MRTLASAVLALFVGLADVVRGAEITGRVVEAEGQGIADAVVFVETGAGSSPRDAAESSENAPRAAMDQVQKEFVPHVLPIVVGTEVSFPNRDQIHHHVYSFSRTKTFETPLYKGEEAPPVLFDRVGAVKVGCNIHDWMSAVILVVPTPHYAVTAADGSFTIPAVPPGSYTVVAWHESSKTKAEQTAKTVELAEPKAELVFTLELGPRPARAAVHGQRRYE